MPLDSLQVRTDQARALAHRRNHSAELARQEAILDGFERDRFQALMAIRGLVEQYGPARVQTWVLNMAKELGYECV